MRRTIFLATAVIGVAGCSGGNAGSGPTVTRVVTRTVTAAPPTTTPTSSSSSSSATSATEVRFGQPVELDGDDGRARFIVTKPAVPHTTDHIDEPFPADTREVEITVVCLKGTVDLYISYEFVARSASGDRYKLDNTEVKDPIDDTTLKAGERVRGFATFRQTRGGFRDVVFVSPLGGETLATWH